MKMRTTKTVPAIRQPKLAGRPAHPGRTRARRADSLRLLVWICVISRGQGCPRSWLEVSGLSRPCVGCALASSCEGMADMGRLVIATGFLMLAGSGALAGAVVLWSSVLIFMLAIVS